MTILFYDLVGRDAGRPFSPHCWKVAMALEHKGLTYRTIEKRFIEVPEIEGGVARTIPVIRDGDKVVVDSFAIALHLDQAYPDRPTLFGGSGSYYYNDVLQIDFAASRWVEIEGFQRVVNSPSGPPCGRDEHAVIFDPHNGLYWSFGGSGYACGSQTGTIAAGSTTTCLILRRFHV